MADDSNYFDQMEEVDAKKFTFFNQKMKWFTNMTQTPKFCKYDFDCTDKLNREVKVELKSRNHPISKYETIFIEPGKYENLINLTKQGYKALYINFLEDYRHVLIFDISKVNPTLKSVRIFNPGYNEHQDVQRYELPVKEGMYYSFSDRFDTYRQHKTKWDD